MNLNCFVFNLCHDKIVMCHISFHSAMNEKYSENKNCTYCLFVCDCIFSVSWGPFRKQNEGQQGHEKKANNEQIDLSRWIS